MESGGKFSSHRRTSGDYPVKSEYDTVLIRNDSGMKLKVGGQASGMVYVFEPGQVLSVRAVDVDYLLSLKSGEGCVGCGGNSAASRFVRVEG